jgi:hypothetical protein
MSAVLLTLLLAQTANAQTANAQTPASQGTYLGALFAPIPEVVWDQLPSLPRGQGVLVTHVLPDSPAETAALKRNDIILTYADTKVRDCEHFALLIQADRPDRKVRVGVVRAGKEMKLDVVLGRGPALRLAPAQRYANQEPYVQRAVAKTGGPPPVSISALPLEKDRLKITIEYYQDGTGKLRTVTAEGTPAEIDDEVRKLPERERALTRKALQQIKALNSPKQQR